MERAKRAGRSAPPGRARPAAPATLGRRGSSFVGKDLGRRRSKETRLREALRAAGRGARLFALEDTQAGCYRDLREALSELGWAESPLGGARGGPGRALPALLWRLSERDIDYDALEPWQSCNHIRGLGLLGTKCGLSACMAFAEAYAGTAPCDFYPRSFPLSDETQEQGFRWDFELTAFACVLKHFEALLRGSTAGPVPSALVGRSAEYVHRMLAGQRAALDEAVVELLLDLSYALADAALDSSALAELLAQKLRRLRGIGGGALGALGERRDAARDHVLRGKVRLAMEAYERHRGRRQSEMEGRLNLWVSKAPGTSKGKGMQVLQRLDDLLRCSRDRGGRVVQKYVESLLLLPAGEARVKFDLRVWALVTSWEPLEVHVCAPCYARRCAAEHSLDVDELVHARRHLTNLSVGDAGGERCVPQEDLLECIGRALADRAAAKRPERPAPPRATARLRSAGRRHWDAVLWPAVEGLVVSTLRGFRMMDAAAHRDRSFELLGFDVILDAQLRPWLLEVNVSPAMSHACGGAQNALIRRMMRGLVRLVVDPGAPDDADDGRQGPWRLVHRAQPLPEIPDACARQHALLSASGRALGASELRRLDAAVAFHGHVLRLQRWLRATRRKLAERGRLVPSRDERVTAAARMGAAERLRRECERQRGSAIAATAAAERSEATEALMAAAETAAAAGVGQSLRSAPSSARPASPERRPPGTTEKAERRQALDRWKGGPPRGASVSYG